MNGVRDNPGTLECNICGRRHRTEQCQLLSKTKKVNDSIAPSKARLSLPTNLQFVYFENGTMSVVAKVPVLTGTLFGPYTAPRSLMIEENALFPIKIFHHDGEGPTFYLDTSNEEECNWMSLILPASSPSEQNLICYQMKDDIYFTSINEIPKGQELRVWYAPYYAKKMGKLAYPSTEESIQSIINDHGYSSAKRKMTKDSQNPRETEVQKLVRKLGPAALGAVVVQSPWKCSHCSFKESEDVTRFAAHLRHHYKPRNKEVSDIHTGSSVECVICNKTFSTPFYLYRHLKKHTGEYTCLQCCKVFARKANLVSHPCLPAQESDRIGGKASFSCFYCNKSYSQEHVLKKHLSKHIHPSTCVVCHKSFSSSRRLKQHRCMVTDSTNANSVSSSHPHSCPDCGREFLRLSALQKHRLIHDPVALSQTLKEKEDSTQHRDKNFDDSGKAQEHVCEICGKVFSSISNLKVHQLSHGEKKFCCSQCPKKFHRRDLWQLHQTVHLEAKVPCPECEKLFKTKHSMEIHLRIHKGKRDFKCEVCGKVFSQKGNLQRHVSTHAALPDKGVICQMCGKLFLCKEYLSTHMLEHTQGKIHQCTKCPRAFVKACLLARHVRLLHGQHKFTCSSCGWLATNVTALRKHLLKQHGVLNLDSEGKIRSWEASKAISEIQVIRGTSNTAEMESPNLIHEVTECESQQPSSFDAILNLPASELNLAGIQLRSIRLEGALDFTADDGHETMLMQYEGDYMESEGINPCLLSEGGNGDHENDLALTTNVLLYVLADSDSV